MAPVWVDMRLKLETKEPTWNPAGFEPRYQSGGSLYRSLKAAAHFVSTLKAMAKGRSFSNCSGPVIIRLKRSDSTRLMNSSNPSTRAPGFEHPARYGRA